MPELILPDSLRFHAIPAHKAALSRIGRTERIPPDLSLDEVRQFHLAKLTDLKIKTDYWCLLHDVWKAVWGPLVDGLDPLPFGANLWDDGAGEIETVWLDEILSASHRLTKDKLLWTAVKLDRTGHSLRLLIATETNGNGADPDWLAFPPPEGWTLVDDDGEDYAPFWRADISSATDSGVIIIDDAEALAADAVAPVYSMIRV